MSFRFALQRLFSVKSRPRRMHGTSVAGTEALESRLLLTGTGIIQQLIGEAELAPVNITLVSPNAATAAGNVLYVGGSHSGQAAYQTIELTTGAVGQVNLLDSLDLAANGSGDNSGAIGELVLMADNSIMAVGDSANGAILNHSTSWTGLSTPQSASTNPNFTGAVADASSSGVIVGDDGGRPSVGIAGGTFAPLAAAPTSIAAVDIATYANGTNIIAGDEIWTGQNGVYTQFDISGFTAPPNGTVPTSFDGVAINPVTDTAIIAGDYLDGATFQNTVGFWKQDGTYLFSFGTEYVDSEVLEGHLVFAVNAADDGIVISADDGSSLTMEQITGGKVRFFDDALFAGSFGFGGTDANGNVVVGSYATNDIDGGGGTEPEVTISGPDSAVRAESLSFELDFIPGDAGGGGSTGVMIEELIDELQLPVVNIALDIPHAATAAGNTLYVGGSHGGLAAYQTVDLTTGVASQINYLDSLDLAANGSGDSAGVLSEIVTLNDARIVATGDTANGSTGAAPTVYFDFGPPIAGSSNSSHSGTVFDVSIGGTTVGAVGGDPSQGTVSTTLQALPHGPTDAVAVDIDTYANGSEIIVGDGIWTGQNGIYTQFDTSGFSVPSNGSVPTSFDGVAVNPVTDTAIIAGGYFDAATFQNTVGFWQQDGTYLFSFGIEYVDSEVLEGHLVFAVNAADDGIVISADDGSSLTMEQITGGKVRFFDDALFAGSFGFGGTDANGDVVVGAYATNDPDSEPQPPTVLSFTVNWGDGSSETFDGPDAVIAGHTFTELGDFNVQVVASMSDGTTTDPTGFALTVNSHDLRDVDGVSTLVVGLNQDGSRLSVYDRQSETHLSVDGVRGDFADVDAVEIHGQEGNDRVYVRGEFELNANLGDGRNRVTAFHVGSTHVVTGEDRDRVFIRSNGEVFVDAGAGNDFIYANGNGRKTLLGGSGNDRLFGFRGENGLFGGDGRDFLYGRGERDILVGGNDPDRIFAFGQASLAVTGDADLDDSLIDDLFGELSQSSPNAATLSSLLDGRTTDDNARDFLFGRRNIWGLVDDEDRVWGRVTTL